MRELFPRRAGRGMVVLVVAPDRSVMSADHLLVWNARGLNSRARRSVVRDTVAQQRASIVCVQESKVANFGETLCHEITGIDFDYVYLPATGVAGGAVVYWRRDPWRDCARCAPLLDHRRAHSSQRTGPAVVAH